MRIRELEKLEQSLRKQEKQIRENIDKTISEISSLRVLETADIIDQASKDLSNTTDLAISQQQLEGLKNIQKALKKIKDGSYGKCEMCKEEISIERLKVKPHAKFCISCREIYEKEKKANSCTKK